MTIRLRGLWACLAGAAGALLLVPPAGSVLHPQDKPNPKGAKAEPTHRVVRVSSPDDRNPVEVAVAINPTNPDHVVAVSMQPGGKGGPGTTNFSYVSADGGKTWKTAPPHHNPGKRTQGDDVVIFTADGLAVRTYISFAGIRQPRPKRAFSGIFVTTSRDGLTWSDPVAVVDHVNSVEPMEDKPWLAADKAKDSRHRGNIYAVWTKFDVYGSKKPEHKSHIYVARSTDQGKTFSPSHRISDAPGDCIDSSKTVMGAVPAVGPKGEVYAVWAGPEGLYFDKSTDGGVTFGKDRVITDTTGWDYDIKGLGRCNGLPMMAVDLSAGPEAGSIYVNWSDKRHGDPDVFVIASRDGGITWTKPLRVNDDPRGNGKEQFFTWMAVDPVDGSVNVVFYDRRDYDGPRTGLTLARSVDGGRSFVNHKIDQEPFAIERGPFFGDYLGIDALGGRVVAVYQHFIENRRIALSAAVFNFKPGTQQLQPAK